MKIDAKEMNRKYTKTMNKEEEEGISQHEGHRGEEKVIQAVEESDPGSRRVEGSKRMRKNHRIPLSFNAFCNIVSFTAANTSRIFVVSVACVR